jgi:hypothetical protein
MHGKGSSGKFTVEQALKVQRGRRGIVLFVISELGGVWVVNTTPRLLLPTGKRAVPIVQKAGWVPVPVWTGAGNLAPHRDSIRGASSPHLVTIPTELSRSHERNKNVKKK